MAKESKDKEQAERYIHPDESMQAAHHLKMAHKVKGDKQLHKAAKGHLAEEHEALSAALGKKDSKKESKKAPPKKKK
jgi:hypothetical protein